MGSILPPSRLLPATIVATSIALAVKIVALISFAPSPRALWAETTKAAMTASVITQAHAAGPGTAAASLPQRPAGRPEPPLPADPATPSSPPPTDVAQAAHAETSGTAPELNLHRSQIEERELRLTQRETAMAAVEKRLTDRTNELVAIQSQLQTLVNSYEEHDEAKWLGLVKLYEGMRPREAASIFNGLDKAVLLEILNRMKPAKAAPVIALMQPENARQVTADLATRRGTPTTATN